MKKFIKLALVALVPLILSSCLTSAYKEYRFFVNKDGSGTGIIKYVNIVSQEDEETDVSETDFNELINDYVNGETFENDNPGYTVTNKRLFEENGTLCGEVEFTFNSFDDIKFKDFDCKCSPLMYYLGGLTETFMESNGEYLSTDEFDFPMITWEKKFKGNEPMELYFKTIVTDDLSDCHSLLDEYEEWERNN